MMKRKRPASAGRGGAVYEHEVEACLHAIRHAVKGTAMMSKFLVRRMAPKPEKIGAMTEKVEDEFDKAQRWLRTARKSI